MVQLANLQCRKCGWFGGGLMLGRRKAEGESHEYFYFTFCFWVCFWFWFATVFLAFFPSLAASKGGRGCLMSPSYLESQDCRLIPLFYLLSCSSAYSCCSFCVVFLLFCSWPFLLTFCRKSSMLFVFV